MFLTFRAITYATLFIGLMLIYLPSRILSSSGIVRPAAMEWPQILGIMIGSTGAAILLWCVFSFVSMGKELPHRSTRRAVW